MATTIFAPDLRAILLQHGRHIQLEEQAKKREIYLGWDPPFSALLDTDREQAAILPICRGPQQCKLRMLLAFTHFWERELPPIERRSEWLYIYNGPCSHCPKEEFQALPRIKELQIEIFWQTPYIKEYPSSKVEKRSVWKKRVTLPDQQAPFRISLKDIPAPQRLYLSGRDRAAKAAVAAHIYGIYIEMAVISTWPGARSDNRQIAAAAEIEYVDRGPDGSLHYWR